MCWQRSLERTARWHVVRSVIEQLERGLQNVVVRLVFLHNGLLDTYLLLLHKAAERFVLLRQGISLSSPLLT